MTDFDSEITRALASQRDEIVKSPITTSADAIRQEIGWKVREVVAKQITSWIEAEVIPEVQVQLVQRRAEIIAHISGCVAEAAKLAGEGIKKKAEENISKSWQFSKLTEALFG